MTRIYWGGLAIDALTVGDSASPNTATRIAQGFEGQRIDLVGIIPVKFAGYNGGFVRGSYIHDWRTELNKVAENTGVQSHLDRVAALGWLLTTQATLTAVDHSGFRAANKRVHAAMYNNRFVATLGTQLFLDTSTSDPALTVPGTSDGLTDLQTSLAVGQIGSTRVLMAAGSTNDDIQYTTDPTAGTVSWTKAVTLTDTPYINWIQYFPELGSGVWIVCGRPSTAAGAGLYWFSKDATLPATLNPVVLEDTATQLDTTSTVLTQGPKSPRGATNVTELNTTVLATGDPWVNSTNTFASDGSKAVATLDSGVFKSDGLLVFDYGFTIPTNATITGVLDEWEKSEGNAADNMVDEYVMLATKVTLAAATVIGSNKADTVTEWPVTASEAYVSYGGTQDSWAAGSELTPSLVNSGGFGGVIVADGEIATAVASVDHQRRTIGYQMPGTKAVPQLGGWTCGALPSNPNVIYSIEPTSDDLTGTTVRRVLKRYEFSWESAGQRPLVDITFPNTGLTYVEDAVPFQGGLLITGDTSSGVGKALKHVDSQGEVRNYNLPAVHGTKQVGIVSMFDLGTAAILEVANEDATDTQWWVYTDGKFSASYPLQSKSNAISSLPIAMAERTLHTSQNRIYRFFPVSTTNLAAARSFVPRNIFDDPLIANTSELKQDGPLFLRTPKFEIGPTENENTLSLLRHLGDQISAVGGTYGTVQYDAEFATDTVDLDTTFATPDVSTSALNTRFQEYKVPSSGVAGRVVMFKVTLDNDATGGNGSTKTPNGLPFLIEMKSKRPLLSQWEIYPNLDFVWNKYRNWGAFVAALKAESAEKNVQTLKFGNVSAPAELVGFSGGFAMPKLNAAIKVPRGGPPRLVYQEVRGSV